MRILWWLYYMVVGTIEVLLLGKNGLGLQGRKGKVKYLILFMAGCFFYLFSDIVSPHTLEYSLLWTSVVLAVFYTLQWSEWIRASLLLFLLMEIMDELILGCVSLFSIDIKQLHTDMELFFLGWIGLSVWVFLFGMLALRKKEVSTYFKELSNFGIWFLLSGVFALANLISLIQGALYEVQTLGLKKLTFLFCITVLLYVAGIFWYLGKLFQKRKYAEKVAEIQEEQVRMQGEYYQNLIRQYEELRGFKHDIRQHMQVLHMLSEEEDIEKIRKYVEQLDQSYEAVRTVYTENKIIDYLLYENFFEMEKDPLFHIHIIGRFPEKFVISEVDSCILFSNLFRNAAETLDRTEGEKELEIEVFQGRNEWCIYIRNTKADVHTDLSQSSKQDRKEHGYGIRNIRQVIGKYGGEISWNDLGRQMEVALFLPIELENGKME